MSLLKRRSMTAVFANPPDEHGNSLFASADVSCGLSDSVSLAESRADSRDVAADSPRGLRDPRHKL